MILLPSVNIGVLEEFEVGGAPHIGFPGLMARVEVASSHRPEIVLMAECAVLWERKNGRMDLAPYEKEVHEEPLACVATNKVPVVLSHHRRAVDDIPFFHHAQVPKGIPGTADPVKAKQRIKPPPAKNTHCLLEDAQAGLEQHHAGVDRGVLIGARQKAHCRVEEDGKAFCPGLLNVTTHLPVF